MPVPFAFHTFGRSFTSPTNFDFFSSALCVSVAESDGKGKAALQPVKVRAAAAISRFGTNILLNANGAFP